MLMFNTPALWNASAHITWGSSSITTMQLIFTCPCETFDGIEYIKSNLLSIFGCQMTKHFMSKEVGNSCISSKYGSKLRNKMAARVPHSHCAGRSIELAIALGFL